VRRKPAAGGLNRAGGQITGLSAPGRRSHLAPEVYAAVRGLAYAELDRKALATSSQVDRPRDCNARRRQTVDVNQRVNALFKAGQVASRIHVT
jgi:hypothetical protein